MLVNLSQTATSKPCSAFHSLPHTKFSRAKNSPPFFHPIFTVFTQSCHDPSHTNHTRRSYSETHLRLLADAAIHHFSRLSPDLTRSCVHSQKTRFPEFFHTHPTQPSPNPNRKLTRPHSPPKLLLVTHPPPPSLAKNFSHPSLTRKKFLSPVTH